MSEHTRNKQPSHIVLVVGVDLSDVSEHLLEQTRGLLGTVDEAEVHLVHVVHPDPLPRRLSHLRSADLGARAHAEYAHWELQRLSDCLADSGRVRTVFHTPIGNTADELTEIASKVCADVIVVEAHDDPGPRRLFHRSVVARLVRTAPCTVLTLRRFRRASRDGATRPEASPGATPSAASN